jgi:hypothetical protein
VDYAVTFTGFALVPFSAKPEVASLSGSVLQQGKKMLTGSVVREMSAEIYSKNGNWYYGKKTTKSDSGSGTVSKASAPSEYLLHFVGGFSKMRLLGKEYAYDPKNLTARGQAFDLDLFVRGSDAYVIRFENVREKESRQRLKDEYDRKLMEIKRKYPTDPYMINTLAKELTKAYDIRADQF